MVSWLPDQQGSSRPQSLMTVTSLALTEIRWIKGVFFHSCSCLHATEDSLTEDARPHHPTWNLVTLRFEPLASRLYMPVGSIQLLQQSHPTWMYDKTWVQRECESIVIRKVTLLTTIALSAKVLHTGMQRPLRRSRHCGGVPKRRWGKVVIEVVQHLATVPGPAHSRGLAVTCVHAQRRPVQSDGDIASGHAKAQRGAQVEQATPGHPLPALAVLLTGGWQDEGVIPHPQATPGALMEESKVIRVQRSCAERGKQ